MLDREPNVGVRYLGTLQRILTFKFQEDLLTAINEFEHLRQQYEAQSGEVVTGKLCMAVLVAGVSESARAHIISNATTLTAYNLMKDAVIQFELMRRD